jgi:hypothetical protein
VDALAERPPDSSSWHLMLSFRLTSGSMRERAFLVPYPLEATSKSALFLQADRLRDADLAQALAAQRS